LALGLLQLPKASSNVEGVFRLVHRRRCPHLIVNYRHFRHDCRNSIQFGSAAAYLDSLRTH